MLFVHDVRPEKADRIPAVRHIDGTARIQTVNRAQHPLYYDLIRAFGADGRAGAGQHVVQHPGRADRLHPAGRGRVLLDLAARRPGDRLVPAREAAREGLTDARLGRRADLSPARPARPLPGAPWPRRTSTRRLTRSSWPTTPASDGDAPAGRGLGRPLGRPDALARRDRGSRPGRGPERGLAGGARPDRRVHRRRLHPRPAAGWPRASPRSSEGRRGGRRAGWSSPCRDRPTDYERDAAGLEGAEFVTANCFCRRDVLEAVGGFDERFAAAWREDSDLHFTLLGTRLPDRAGPRRGRRPPGPPGPLGRQPPAAAQEPVRRPPVQEAPASYTAGGSGPRPPGIITRWSAASRRLRSSAALGSPGDRLAAAVALGGADRPGSASGDCGDTSTTPGTCAEMAVTSALIPPLSVFWRLYGALKFRVLFL